MEYRDIGNYPGYRVGENGTVWSCWSIGPSSKITEKWRQLKLDVSNRYPSFRPRDGQGSQKTIRVHTVVAEAFLGARPPGMDVLHKDGNALNNHRCNLAYGTKKQNMQDRSSHGRTAMGEMNGQSKLTLSDISAIRKNDANVTNRQLAARYGVHESTIRKIKKRKKWAHV